MRTAAIVAIASMFPGAFAQVQSTVIQQPNTETQIVEVQAVDVPSIGAQSNSLQSVEAQSIAVHQTEADADIRTGLHGRYSQSRDFWKTVDQLKEKQDYHVLVSEYFDSKRKQAQEAWFGLDLDLETESPATLAGLSKRTRFTMGIESIAGGRIRNRISPTINAYDIYHAHFDLVLKNGTWVEGSRLNRTYYESGFGYAFGTRAGFGKQRLLGGEVSSYLLDSQEKEFSIQEISLIGGASYAWWLNSNLRSATSGRLDPSFFHSTDIGDEFGSRVEGGSVVTRWRLENETMFHFSPRPKGGFAMGASFISGPQPLPFDGVLPRVWDPVHKELIKFKLTPGNFGAGPIVEWVSASRNYGIRGVGGYYGGYFGGGAELKLGVFYLQAGSFGIELSERYRSFENRVLFAQGGLSFDW
ncbi:hypothetical protein GW915_03090 [bacterium]|nr:hypothetical protein [bacterium]